MYVFIVYCINCLPSNIVPNVLNVSIDPIAQGTKIPCLLILPAHHANGTRRLPTMKTDKFSTSKVWGVKKYPECSPRLYSFVDDRQLHQIAYSNDMESI
jgi:hypothetical protein